ncbi:MULTISPECIES: malonyl-ACP O-methyltransferase BioC [Vibrio]|uniref:malonyl-ACP O-methyltransferase BioC n=1 Tax=Vibrio TaxID=662 RepID=UPI000B5CB8A8|nr:MULTISPECIES: malonyl-ACP O-methyltransferase BioC [Vibrio]HBV75388.1 malonyl-[acyl-carrier protein] O-methyltransferase BioC [Vibrio sp.]
MSLIYQYEAESQSVYVPSNSSDLNSPNVVGNKRAIAQAFGKAAKTYDEHAAFQRNVGHCLLKLLPHDLSGLSILDLGCGTGYFSQQLALRGAQVTAFDLSDAMLEQCRLRCRQLSVEYIQGDAETLSFESEQFNIIFSSLAIQWCDDLDALVKSLINIIQPSGKVIFSTLLEGSLFELQQSWKNVDENQHVNQFHHLSSIQRAVDLSDAISHHIECVEMISWYDSSLGLMRDLKGIGATHVTGRSNRVTKKSDLSLVEEAYQVFCNPMGQLPATYQVCLGCISK